MAAVVGRHWFRVRRRIPEMLDSFRIELRHAVAGQIRRLPVGGTVWPLWMLGFCWGFLSLTVDRLTGFEVRFLSIICFSFFENTLLSSSYSVFNGLGF